LSASPKSYPFRDSKLDGLNCVSVLPFALTIQA
jgi:hypothetical protein